MNQHQGRLRGISRIYESFGENLAHLGIAGQDVKIVMRALSGAGVQWIIRSYQRDFVTCVERLVETFRSSLFRSLSRAKEYSFISMAVFMKSASSEQIKWSRRN